MVVFCFFSGYYDGYVIFKGVTFFSVERAFERAVCAYDSDIRTLNSDSDSRGIRCFFSCFVVVIMMGIFAQTLATYLGAVLRHLSMKTGITGSNGFLYCFIFF